MTCCVCATKINDTDESITLKCDHIYHVNCIRTHTLMTIERNIDLKSKFDMNAPLNPTSKDDLTTAPIWTFLNNDGVFKCARCNKECDKEYTLLNFMMYNQTIYDEIHAKILYAVNIDSQNSYTHPVHYITDYNDFFFYCPKDMAFDKYAPISRKLINKCQNGNNIFYVVFSEKKKQIMLLDKKEFSEKKDDVIHVPVDLFGNFVRNNPTPFKDLPIPQKKVSTAVLSLMVTRNPSSSTGLNFLRVINFY